MADPAPKPVDLGLGRMIRIFAGLSVALVAALAVAPARSRFTEWRAVQDRHGVAAAAAGQEPMEPGIQQIWNRSLGVVDRCTSCHVGMGPAEPIPGGDPLFAAHPKVPHDLAEYGCTVCHGGEGRATTKHKAHGEVHGFAEPLLARDHFEAGCGTCHSAFPVGAPELAARGRILVERHDCLSCHRIDGRGGARHPGAAGERVDLSGAGLAGVPADWHARHLERRRRAAADAGPGAPVPPIVESYGPMPDGDVAAIFEYLKTLVAAPRLAEGKRLFHEKGCRGCHKVNGVGGEDGPDLSLVGRRLVGDVDFAGVRGKRTPFAWQVAHLLSPATVVPGSAMPDLALERGEAERIALYLLSLRRAEVPAAYSPPDRLRVERLKEREFATDGRSLYGVFCAACHGDGGEGRRYGELAQAFPAVASADFLAVASDRLILDTLRTGRPGRRMPAWGGTEGGLRAAETDAVVGWLRSRQPAAPPWEAVARAPVDVDLGRRAYARDCAICHGAAGAGTRLAGPLALPEARDEAGARSLYDATVDGRPDTAMPAFRGLDATTLRSLIAHMQSWERPATAPRDTPTAGGDKAAGEELYTRHCAGCHGPRGEGKEAPALANPAFLAAATDGYIAATVVRGRRGTAMPGFGVDQPGFPRLSDQEIRDVVSFVRSFTSQGEEGKPDGR